MLSFYENRDKKIIKIVYMWFWIRCIIKIPIELHEKLKGAKMDHLIGKCKLKNNDCVSEKNMAIYKTKGFFKNHGWSYSYCLKS